MATARILVVEDDGSVLHLVCRMLTENGYQPLSAEGPRQALEIISSIPSIDLVVSDNRMPEREGTDLVREIVRRSPQTACLIMTGEPFSTADLIHAIQGTLARRPTLIVV